jgi:flagellar hook-associated protein 2
MSSPTTAAPGSTLQTISGLASGIDTSSIVSALMAVAKLPEVAIQNRMTVETARQGALSSVLTELNSLTTSYQALTDVGTWADVQTITSSNSAAVNATRTGGAAAGAYSIAVQSLARANQFTSGGTTTATANDKIHITTGAGTTDVTISAGDTLDVVAAKINNTTGSPVYATLFNGQLVLSNKQTGTANAVTGVTTDGGSGFTFAQTQTAQDAAFTIDGASHTSSSNTVTDAMAGVTLTLSAQTAGTSIVVGEPTADVAGITTKLNAFVNQYNTVIEDIQSRITDQPVASPQTDADRVKGVLYGDQSLQRLLSNLRNSFSDVMGGSTSQSYQQLSQVGLSTGAAVGSGSLNSDAIDGKMTVDMTKFTTALNSNFDATKALFTNSTGQYATEGLGQRLQGIISPYTAPLALNGYLNTSIDSETSTIKDLQGQVNDWETRLAIKQQTLQAQFTAMETALSQTQSESASLTSAIAQLGTGG